MLNNLVQFDPRKRKSAKECLESKMFDDIRVRELEKGAPFKIYLGCDDNSDHVDNLNKE